MIKTIQALIASVFNPPNLNNLLKEQYHLIDKLESAERKHLEFATKKAELQDKLSEELAAVTAKYEEKFAEIQDKVNEARNEAQYAKKVAAKLLDIFE